MLNAQSPDQLLDLGLQSHRRGDLPQAEAFYRQVLALAPNHADAWHLLGVLASNLDRHAEAIAAIERALTLKTHPVFLCNLGEALRKAGLMERAEKALRKALALDPGLADASFNLSVVLFGQGFAAEALPILLEATQRSPAHAPLRRLLGDALARLGRIREAIDAYREALRLDPSLADAWFNLGVELMEVGQPEESAAALRRASVLSPDDLQARLMLAEVLTRLGKLEEARAEFQAVLARDPSNSDAHLGLGKTFRAGEHLDEAAASYQKALKLRPGHAATLANLALCLRDLGHFGECTAMLRDLLTREPGLSHVRSNLILSLQLDPDATPDEITAEQQTWNQLYVEPARPRRQPHHNDPSPTRRLRIGYLSADFRAHPLARFMQPLLFHHDPAAVEIFCYSNTQTPDRITHELQQILSDKSGANHWRTIYTLNDDQAADLIRADQIDILVDLSNHTAANRLGLFALKPAPVQITYLGYNAPTGLSTIDWRLTDRHIDPPESSPSQAALCERPLHLPETYWCYAPHPDAGEVTPEPPMLRAGHITFGCFNYFSKLNHFIFNLWARVLADLPHSRLLLYLPPGSLRQAAYEFFRHRGIAPDRITPFPRTTEQSYFARHAEIDIALDTYPWAGGTTTCDALWMGVPVLTLAGQSPLSRGGVSILTNAGLSECISHTPDQFVGRAVSIARDPATPTSLAELRRTLRGRLRHSPLMDAPRFARHIEHAYRQAWQSWTLRRPPHPPVSPT